MRVLPNTHAKQMQRYLDKLESARIMLVEYRSKTRGAWRLALLPQQVKVDREEADLLPYLGFRPHESNAGPLIDVKKLAISLRQVLISDALYAEHGLNATEMEVAEAAYRSIVKEPKASPQMRVGIKLRLCALYRQRNDFDAWRQEILAMEKLINNGKLENADVAARLDLQRMLLAHDTGQYEAAYHILERIDVSEIQDSFTLGHYWNAMGLAMLNRSVANCNPAGCHFRVEKRPCHIGLALEYLSIALNHSLVVNDYGNLEEICFNIGNAMQCSSLALQQPEGELQAAAAAQWIGLCEMIRHRFGVGGASQRARITLAEISVNHEWDFARLNYWVGGLYQGFGNLEGLLQATLDDAIRRNNRLEQAECCRLLARYHDGQPDGTYRAAWYREEAIVIYRDFGRADKVAALAPPPAISACK